MKTLTRLTLLIIIILSLFSLAARRCPLQQSGLVTGQLSPEGYTILSISYPCGFATTPRLLASPTGQGSLSVERFEANPLTATEGSIAVKGEPGAVVSFTWYAFAP